MGGGRRGEVGSYTDPSSRLGGGGQDFGQLWDVNMSITGVESAMRKANTDLGTRVVCLAGMRTFLIHRAISLRRVPPGRL